MQPLTSRAGDVIDGKRRFTGPNSTVEVRVVGTGVGVDLGEVQANSEGDFSARFRLPEDLKPGTYQVTATGAENATTSITVPGIVG